MSDVYVDTSVLAAYYAPEPLSEIADEFLQSAAGPTVSLLVEVELASAMSRKVRARELDERSASAALLRFRQHLDAQYYRRLVPSATHFNDAKQYLVRFDLPLRTLDALHLALANAHRLSLATADRNLAHSARLLGYPVIELGQSH